MEGGRGDGLERLLPKSISEKRRLRKQKKTGIPGTLRQKTSSLASSDGTSVSNMADDDEDDDGRSFNDNMSASFGSFESGPEPESAKPKSSRSSKAESRNASRSPSRVPRPAAVSQHPSAVGYLTTSSPAVQAAHIVPQAQPPSPSQSSTQLPTLAGRPNPRSSPRPASAAAATSTGTPAGLSTIDPPTAAKVAPSPSRPRTAKDAEKRALPPLRSPLAIDTAAPAIVNTPPTPIQAPLSESGNPEKRAADDPPASRVVNTHKRSTSASASIGPSKLSNILTNPLTPPVEGNEGSANNSGFFSSMISAAQSAANNLSTNIQNTGIGLGGNKGRATPSKSPDPSRTRSASQPEEASAAPAAPTKSNDTMDQKDSAVRTLGAGDLSLSQLGLEEQPSSVASPTSARSTDTDTRARSESAPADTQTSNGEFMPEDSSSRPRSLNEGANGDVTPPQPPPQIEIDDKAGMSRTDSLRRTHRKRGSSVTTVATGVNFGSPLAGVTSPVSQAARNFSTPKLTGFAIASKKRNREFHGIFKSVPDDDYLIEDYSCALQREILAHGRLYVSEGHLCFSSNIMGWTTTLVMSFDEIVSVEKRSTALIFKNGLIISTLHAKHVFASFTSRDATYDLIVNIWKLGHPTLTSTLNGVQVDTGGDKTEKLDTEPSPLETESQADSGSEEESEEEGEDFYDEEDVEEGSGDEEAELASEGGPDKAVARKTSGMTTANGVPAAASKDTAPGTGATEFPGPTTHAPTECGDAAAHYDKVVGDDVIAAPLGKVYSLMFGAESAAFMTKFLTADQKCTELQMDDKKGLSLENKSRTYNYIKPLYGAIGPKSTKCIVTETVDNLDYEKAANLTMSTQTPDVPNGNVFVVKTKYCLSWAENNSTRVQVNCTIEWSGKSWIKGPIEKGANEGQTDYCKAILAALRAAISSRTRSGTGPNGTSKGKKKGKKGKISRASDAAEQAAPKHAAETNWGMLEPIRQLVEPVTDIVKPLLTGNVMYGLLVGLLVSTWFGFGFSPSRGVSPYGPHANIYGPDRLAAYEEIWRREDSELWDWLDERIGLERLNADCGNARRRHVAPRTAEQKLREEQMDLKEVEAAVRVTEEKLRVLQEAIARSSQVTEGAGSHDPDSSL